MVDGLTPYVYIYILYIYILYIYINIYILKFVYHSCFYYFNSLNVKNITRHHGRKPAPPKESETVVVN